MQTTSLSTIPLPVLLHALWGMARPLQLLAIGLVYGLGVLIARADGYTLVLSEVLAGLVMLIPVAMSVHYANEYADYETDALTTRTPFSGGSGVLPGGGVPRILALYALIGAFGAGVVLMLIFWPGIIAAVILLLIAFWGWMYSLPPLALAWRGWGELDNALLGGLSLHVYAYTIISDTLTLDVFLIAMPFTMLVFLNLLATTWPDRGADALVGKFTLATLWPPARLRRLYAGVALAALIVTLALYERVVPAEVTALSLLVVPVVVWAGWRYTRQESPFFSVLAMVLLLLLNIAAWYAVG